MELAFIQCWTVSKYIYETIIFKTIFQVVDKCDDSLAV